MKHDEIIDALGGPMKLAADLGCHHSQPVRWKATGIPPRRWRAVENLAVSAGVDGITVAIIAAGAPDDGGDVAALRAVPPAKVA